MARKRSIKQIHNAQATSPTTIKQQKADQMVLLSLALPPPPDPSEIPLPPPPIEEPLELTYQPGHFFFDPELMMINDVGSMEEEYCGGEDEEDGGFIDFSAARDENGGIEFPCHACHKSHSNLRSLRNHQRGYCGTVIPSPAILSNAKYILPVAFQQQYQDPALVLQQKQFALQHHHQQQAQDKQFYQQQQYMKSLYPANSPEPIEQIERPFYCKMEGCEKTYRNLNGLKYHVRVAHEGYSMNELKGDLRIFKYSNGKKVYA